MTYIERFASALSRTLAVAGLAILLGFAVTTIADGMLRFFLGRPIDAVRDLAGPIVAIAVVACLPLALLERSNIAIRFVTRVLGSRASRIADVISSTLVVSVLSLMAWQFGVFARQLENTGALTWMLRIPVAPFWWIVAGILWISALTQIVVICKYLLGEYDDAVSEPPH